MRDEISSVDLHFLIRESQYLVGGKVEKLYESDHFLIHFHIPTKGNRFLKVTDKAMFLIPEKEEMPERPTQFAMILRKKLANARLRELSQLGFERIAVLDFTTKEKSFRLIIELFGGGNIIVCDENGAIQIAKKYVVFKDREIKRGAKYEFPQRRVLEENEFIDALSRTARDNVSKALAMDIGLGGFYAGELCARAGITPGEKQGEKAAKTLFKEFRRFLDEKISPVVIGKDAYPIQPSSGDDSKKTFPSFSEAIASLNQMKKREERSVELTKAERIANEQEKKIMELIREADDDKRKGEMIYENYALLSEMLSEIRKARERYPWDEIKKRLKGHKVVKEIDERAGKMKVEL